MAWTSNADEAPEWTPDNNDDVFVQIPMKEYEKLCKIRDMVRELNKISGDYFENLF